MAIYDIVSSLESSGVFMYLLPFLLVFTIIFAILEKTAVFGKSKEGHTKTGVNAVIGIILGMLVTSQWDIVNQMNMFLPKMSLVIIIFVMFLLLMGVIGMKIEKGARGIFGVLFGVASLLGLYWSLSPDFIFRAPYWVIENQGTILWVTVLLIVLFVIVKSGKKDPSSKKSAKDIFSGMNELMGLGED